MLRSILTCSALILSLLAGSALAGPDEMRRAAEQGDAEMQLELGVLYEYGYGLKENAVPALAWYMIAADQGNGRAAQRRDALKQRMSAAEIAQAERQVEVLRAAIAERKTATPAAPVPVQAPAPATPPPGPMPVSAPASASPAAEAVPASATPSPSTEPSSDPAADAPAPAGPTAPAP